MHEQHELAADIDKNEQNGDRTEVIPRLKKKLVIIDHANLYAMKNANGIRHLKWDALYKILAEDIGESELQKAVVVLTRVDDGYVGKRLSANQFAKKIVESRDNNEDDTAIIDLIRTASQDFLDELVLVSCDLDFMPVLRKKQAQGIKIYVVGTEKNGSGSSTSMISSEMRDTFIFKELGDYKAAIMDKEWTEKEVPRQRHLQTSRVAITLEIPHELIGQELAHAQRYLLGAVKRLNGIGHIVSTCKVEIE